MKNTFQGTEKYIAAHDLMNAVNIAIELEKPLLVKGEPGTGKTMLADAIAKALGSSFSALEVMMTMGRCLARMVSPVSGI